MGLVVQMHKNLGHSGEERTLAKICKRHFWHNRTKDVRTVVKVCQQCQMVRRMGSIRFEDEELKSIPVCDLFYKTTMDTAGPYLKPSQETNIFWWLSTITLNGARQKLLLIMVLRLQPGFWKMT